MSSFEIANPANIPRRSPVKKQPAKSSAKPPVAGERVKAVDLPQFVQNLSDSNQASESDIQAAFFRWCEQNLHVFEDLEFFFHVPNGGHRAQKTAIEMKRTGAKSGVPDVLLLCPSDCGNFNGLVLEFKRPKAKPFANQKKWLAYLARKRFRCAVVTSWRDAARISIEHLALNVDKLVTRP